MTSQLNYFAQKGLELMMRRGYEEALQNGSLRFSPEGWECFSFKLPVMDQPVVQCARLPDGSFRLQLESLHQALGGDELTPFEHFEHQAHEIAKEINREQRRGGGGFG